MRRGKFVISVLLAVWTGSYAQNVSEMEVIMDFVGAGSPDELDGDEYERLYDMLEHPLKINFSKESELTSSGLFTMYQAASFIDYRSRNGDVLSFMELASVDGFGENFVERIRPFISLDARTLPVQSDHASRSVRNDIAVRGAGRLNGTNEEADWNYGLKYRIKAGDYLSATMAFSRPYDAANPAPELYSCSVALESEKLRGRMFVGDFNARFGQGVTVWNGLMVNSMTSPETFMKKPSGLSQSWSYTGSSAFTGVAADVCFRQFRVAVFTAFPGLKEIGDKPEAVTMMPCANIAWQGRSGQVSITHVMQFGKTAPYMKSSADAAFCIRGTNVYGELAYAWSDRSVQVVAGTDFPVTEDLRMASLLRCNQGTLYGLAISGAYDISSHKGTFSVDSEYYPVPKSDDETHSLQLKFQLNWQWAIMEGLILKTRLSERLRTWGLISRTDLRTDLSYSKGPFLLTARINLLKCRDLAFVSYVEGGARVYSFSAHLRQGFFIVDNWDDRIYVYERDAPGSFNVPAMYGRGLWTSLMLSWSIVPAVRFYLRASCTSYPFMSYEKKKPGRAELKLQFVFRL